MKPLFSKLGLQLIESMAISDPIYAFDFDGTLAPIVRDPEAAGMNRTVLQAIESLSRVGQVAIVSGRSVTDLKQRVPLNKVILIGNHGLEGLDSRKDTLKRAKKTCEAWQKKLRVLLGNSMKDLGVSVEDKTYSLALHYRSSRSKKMSKLLLLEKVAELSPSPRVILGKCVINLIPAGGPHKGVALLELMRKFKKRSAIYVGDDDTDEDVFTLPDEGILTVRVGKKSSSAAQFFLERQSEIRRMILLALKAKAGL